MKDRTEEIKALRAYNVKHGYDSADPEWLDRLVGLLKDCKAMFSDISGYSRGFLRILTRFDAVEYAGGVEDILWLPKNLNSIPLCAAGIYRIAPDYQLPDLTEEGKPRYEKGTPLVFKPSGKVYIVADRTKDKPDDAPDDWCAFERVDGDKRCYTYDFGRLQQLPPKPTLQDGWELTGKAVCCDGTQKLADGEAWVGLNARLFQNHFPSATDCNHWRWVARRVEVKKEPVEQTWLSVHVQEGDYTVRDIGDLALVTILPSADRGTWKLTFTPDA